MLKKLMLAAMAAVSMSAFAEDPQQAPRWKEVEMEARNLNAGDQYYLMNWLDRLPSQQERLLVEALSNIHRSAWTIHGKMHVESTRGDDLNRDRTVEVRSWENWSMSDDDMRALRFVMDKPKTGRDVTYVEAMDILQAGLDWTERGMMFELWNEAPERAKDIIVRYIMANADIADYPAYRWRNWDKIDD